MSNGNLVGLFFLDLQKALESFDHSILLEKLGNVDIGSVDWFRS